MEASATIDRIDPDKVRLAPWPGRWEWDVHSSEFRKLVDSVSCTGGNIQPVYVAPLTSSSEVSTAESNRHEYQLILGQRRLLACRESGQPLYALVTSALSPRNQFVAAIHENSLPANRLSDFEMGRRCVSALDLGLFRSPAELANSCGLPASYVGEAVLLGRLVDEIIQIFPDPRRINANWAMPLSDMHHFDREGFLGRAERCKASARPLTARQTYELLVAPAFRGTP